MTKGVSRKQGELRWPEREAPHLLSLFGLEELLGLRKVRLGLVEAVKAREGEDVRTGCSSRSRRQEIGGR